MRSPARGSRTVQSLFGAFTPDLGYIGPGDIVSGALGWWGLRAYKKTTIGTNAIRLRRDSDNAESNFVTIAGGGLDLAAITSFKGAANLFVTTVYDQSGNGNDTTQTTAGLQPAFLLSVLGSNPAIQTVAGVSQSLAKAVSNFPALDASVTPVVMSQVSQNTTNASTQMYLIGGTFNGGYSDSTTYFIYDGSVQNYTVTASTWYSIGDFFNGASSNLYLNGVAQGASNPSNTPTGANASLEFPFRGGAGGTVNCTEIGVWNANISGQMAALSSNQRAYWGF